MLTALRARRRAAAAVGRKVGRDWSYAAPGFEAALAHLAAHPDLVLAQPEIWRHGSNRVFRLTLPSTCGGDDVAYKLTRGKRRWRRAFSASPSTREAVNLLALADLGFPMVDLLAVGETRTVRCWTGSFLVTRFASGYTEGRHILPGFAHGDDEALRDDVIRAALQALARLHRLRIFHKGYKLYNMLWRREADNVTLRFLDVASCRFLVFRLPLEYVVRDLGYFLAPFAFPPETLERWTAYYLEHNPGCTAGPGQLLDQLQPWLRDSGFNWEQVERNAKV